MRAVGKEIVGIKKSGESLEDTIFKIIKRKRKFIIIGTYSIWLPKKIYDALITASCPVIVIMPIKGWDSKMIGKNLYVSKRLRSYGISTIYDAKNHAKFLLTDKEVYVGSGNFTEAGFKGNNENVHVLEEGILYKIWRKEIVEYVEGLINSYKKVVDTKESISEIESKMDSIVKEFTDKIKKNKFKDMIKEFSEVEEKVKEVMNEYQKRLDNEYQRIVVKNDKIKGEVDKVKDIYMSIQCTINNTKESLNTELKEKGKYSEVWLKREDYSQIKEKLGNIHGWICDIKNIDEQSNGKDSGKIKENFDIMEKLKKQL